LLINAGDGQFQDQASERGVVVGNDVISPALASTIIDIDFDGDQDIHVAVDKTPIDGLFIQQPDGLFQNIALEAGMNYIMDSMSSSICDFDHDGDFDIYVTNNTLGNYFFVDQGNLSYTNESGSLGIAVHQYCWGALWVDMNNDTWDDLYVAGEPVLYPLPDGVFLNSGDGTFEPLLNFADEFPLGNSFALAKGDFNRDGYYDIVMNGIGLPLQVYYNNGGTNRWLNVTLRGNQSNRDGVGALLEYWIDGHRMIRHTSAGDSYLSQNSQHHILGCGQADWIDELIVHWPSGQKDSLSLVPTNQYLLLEEGNIQWGPWSSDSGLGICPDDSVVVSHASQYPLIWPDGFSGVSRTISQPQTCIAWWRDDGGYIHPMESLLVVNAEVSEPVAAITPPVCAGFSNGACELIVSEPWLSISWSSGHNSPLADSLAAGELVFYGITADGCEVQSTFIINEPLPLEALFVAESPLCYDSSDGIIALSIASGGTAPYSFQVFGTEGELLAPEAIPAGEFLAELTDAQGCSLQSVVTVISPEPLNAALIPQDTGFSCEPAGGVPPYIIRWNGVEGGINSGPLLPGTHQVEVEDSHGCTFTTTGLIAVSVASLAAEDQVNCIRQSGDLLEWICDSSPPVWMVFDDQGRFVARYSGSRIDFSLFGAGMYHIRLIYPDHSMGLLRVFIG
jgi:hypothetical protein